METVALAYGNIIVASVKAYLAALNKMLVATGQYVQQPEVAATLN